MGESEKDRRSRMAVSTVHAPPKKGGAGGHFTWGSAQATSRRVGSLVFPQGKFRSAASGWSWGTNDGLEECPGVALWGGQKWSLKRGEMKSRVPMKTVRHLLLEVYGFSHVPVLLVFLFYLF